MLVFRRLNERKTKQLDPSLIISALDIGIVYDNNASRSKLKHKLICITAKQNTTRQLEGAPQLMKDAFQTCL